MVLTDTNTEEFNYSSPYFKNILQEKNIMYGKMKREKKMKGEMVKKPREKANMGRMMYNKGGATQPEYKSGDMPKCMPN